MFGPKIIYMDIPYYCQMAKPTDFKYENVRSSHTELPVFCLIKHIFSVFFFTFIFALISSFILSQSRPGIFLVFNFVLFLQL